MKKLIIFAGIVSVFMLSCQQKETITEKKDKLFKLKEQVEKLENELKKSDTISHGKKVKVKTDKLEKKSVKHYFKVTGSVQAKKFAYVSPETNGQIQKIYVEEGQQVKKGQLLAQLNARVQQNSKKELELALELAETMLEKQKKLKEQNVGKEVDYLNAKNQKESLEAKIKTLESQIAMSRITAPFSGIIDKVYRKEGELASPGQQFIDLVNLSNLEVEADVSEKYLPYLDKGDSVTISFPTFPGKEIQTKISRTGNVINPANRTFVVEVQMPNRNGEIKPNMIAELKLSDYEGNDILVPSDAIKTDKKGHFVFVKKKEKGKNIAQKRYVKTGRHISINTIITEGLSEGEEVITEGYNLLTDGTEIYE